MSGGEEPIDNGDVEESQPCLVAGLQEYCDAVISTVVGGLADDSGNDVKQTISKARALRMPHEQVAFCSRRSALRSAFAGCLIFQGGKCLRPSLGSSCLLMMFAALRQRSVS